MRPDNVATLLQVRPAELVLRLLPLDLVLEELERPDYPERGRRHDARGEELPLLRVHEASVPPAHVQHADEAAQEAHVPHQDDREAAVDLGVLPRLVRLPAHLAVLEGALDERAEDASADAAGDRPKLDAAAPRHRLGHESVALELRVEELSDRELARTVDDGAEEGRKGAAVKASHPVLPEHVLRRAHRSALLAEMLGLRLHLCLDGVGRVADDHVGRAVEEPREQRIDRLLLPGGPLLIVSHYKSVISIN